MSSDLTWRINGVDLDDGTLGFLADVSMWRPPITVRRTPVVVPGRHGEIVAGLPVFEAPLVTISAWVDGDSHSEVEQATNAFVGLLTQPSLTITRVSGGVVASAAASLVSLSTDDFMIGTGSRMTAVLSVPGVFLREPAAESTPIPFQTDVTLASVASLSGSTGPVAPILRITGPVTNPTVTSSVTGTSISWNGSVPSGQYLYLDVASLSARLTTSATAWLSGGTNVTSGVDYQVGGVLQLWPEPNPGVAARTNLQTIPRATGSWSVSWGTGGAGTATVESDSRWAGGVARKAAWTTAPTVANTTYIYSFTAVTVAVGQTYVISARYLISGATFAPNIRFGGSNVPTFTYGPAQTIDHGDGTKTVWNTATCTSAGAGGNLTCGVYELLPIMPIGAIYMKGDVLVEAGTTFTGYGDGSMPGWRWAGAVNASTSTLADQFARAVLLSATGSGTRTSATAITVYAGRSYL